MCVTILALMSNHFQGGIAGERYPLEFLSAVKQSLGARPLFKYKAFGQTYRGAADTYVISYFGIF